MVFKNEELLAVGIEPSTSRSWVNLVNHLTTNIAQLVAAWVVEMPRIENQTWQLETK